MSAAGTPPRALLAAGAVGFLTLGVLQAMYGPAFGLFQSRYGVGTEVVATVVSAHFLGSALAPPGMGLLLRRLSVRAAVTLALGVLAAGVLGVAGAPSWPLALAAAFVGGVGLGGVSAAMNAAYASMGTGAVNLVNAVFGLGSMASPVLVAGLAGVGWPAGPFVVVAALAALTFLAGRRWGVPEVRAPSDALAQAAHGPRTLALFAAMLMCYVGLEAAYGAWTARYLDSLGRGGGTLALSAFWGALTLGRVMTGLFGDRLRPWRLLLGCAAVATLGSALLAVPAVAPLAPALAGLAMGPVFGTALAWMSRLLSARLVPYLLVAGSVGGILVPAVLGVAFARFGPPAVPGVLAALGAALCAGVVLTRRLTWVLARSPARAGG